MRIRFFGVVAVCFFLGCSSSPEGQPKPLDLKRLASTDLGSISGFRSTGLTSYDQDHHSNFTKIFGGATGADVQNYFHARIKYLVTADDQDVSVSPSNILDPQGWNSDPSQSQRLSSDHAQIGAANIGGEIFLSGRFQGETPELSIDGQSFAMTTPRQGIMIFGPGYQAQVQVKGKMIDIPAIYRQAILIHEARHSDCTGGVPQAAIDLAKASFSPQDFSKSFNKLTRCTHLHEYCPSGSQYEGLAACDSESFGAYGVQSIFEDAYIAQLEDTDSTIDWEVAESLLSDSQSRLINVWATDTTPDMSSSP